MTRSLHLEAERELVEAFAWYRAHGGDAIARSFLKEFERAAALLSTNPGFGTSAGGGRRSYPLRRFPYSLIFRQSELEILILVVSHQHRRPGYWRDRK